MDNGSVRGPARGAKPFFVLPAAVRRPSRQSGLREAGAGPCTMGLSKAASSLRTLLATQVSTV